MGPHWDDREIKSITREDFYSVVYEKFDPSLSPNARGTLLKQIRRIFQMAMEEVILDRNPTVGITVQVPEVEQDVLTNEEVKTFLQAAKDTNHRFEQAQVIREFCVSIGVTSVKFHDLRATFITNLLARGIPLAVVMAIVGHSQLKTTNGYLRKAGVDVQGGTEKLGYKLPQMSGAKIFTLTKRV